MTQIIDVSLQNFESEVSIPSMEKPMVLTFLSSRYPECGNLFSTLQLLAEEMNFTLAKVDLDQVENQAFIQYFRISGIPDTRVIFKGEIVDMIQGVATEQALRERLSKHFISDSERLYLQIETAIADKEYEIAFSLLNEALSSEPDNKKLKILQAKLFVGLGDTEKARSLLESFKPQEDEYEKATHLLKLLDFYTEAAQKSPVEGEALLYRNACQLVTESNYEEAFETFLKILQINKEWNDGMPRKAMMTLFGVLGPKHELTWKYRAKLNSIWFI
ncbi:MAG: tetratricopeptide repeat protein [Fibrobacteraceae bacterium]|nr:tetratricopeptide repeat protein [Fibrobacteraceae bacterium]